MTSPLNNDIIPVLSDDQRNEVAEQVEDILANLIERHLGTDNHAAVKFEIIKISSYITQATIEDLLDPEMR